MSRRDALAIGVGAALLAGALLAWPASRLAAARERERVATAALGGALAMERELTTLRSADTSRLATRAPEGDVAALVQAALRDAGLPVQHLAEVVPQESSVMASPDPGVPRWRRQGVVLRLQPMPLPDVGSFLDRWRATRPEWAIVQIDLQASEARSEPGGLFAARLTLSTTTLDRTDP